MNGFKSAASGLLVAFIVLAATADAVSLALPDLCYLPPDTGVCRAYIPSFYFDSEAGVCSSFVYGGCLGNANRFRTLEDCQATCSYDTGLPPTCGDADCCNGFITPGCEAVCTQLSCPSSCSVQECCSLTSRNCGNECIDVYCPPLCTPYSCCSRNIGTECRYYCLARQCPDPGFPHLIVE